eukprot:4450189-Pyramimonas_sp.AAC.1
MLRCSQSLRVVCFWAVDAGFVSKFREALAGAREGPKRVAVLGPRLVLHPPRPAHSLEHCSGLLATGSYFPQSEGSVAGARAYSCLAGWPSRLVSVS